MRRTLTSVAEGLGLALVSLGVALIFVPAGVIVAGAALVAIGYRQGGEE